ncbi:MarR family winged helix-turn-helix transcriptional regulator [Nocardia nova]|uniref:MarR family winged helix-turn-helix transcriptional regulator n=1 Tax=Nocardia nova TaxID=37330 RepID=UPI0037ABEF5F
MSDNEDVVAEIEKSLVGMRRSMTRRTLQRRTVREATASAGYAAILGVLDAIEGGAAVTVGDVAEAVDVDQPRASRLVAAAVENDYLRRVADPADGRRSLLELTTRGRQALDEVHRTRRAAVAAATATWSERERAEFARLLGEFVAAWVR